MTLTRLLFASMALATLVAPPQSQSLVAKPNIDRLAREGTDFQRFTVASGVCSPSRTAVMTGHFPDRYNIDGHFAWVPSNAKRNMPDWLDPKAPLLNRFLQSAGYCMAHYGKWHLANDMIPHRTPRDWR